MTAEALWEEESMSHHIFTAVEIKNLKLKAKKMSKLDGISHVEALNLLAVKAGFASWWHLQHLSGKAQPASSNSPSNSDPSSSDPSSSDPSGSSAESIIEDLLPDLGAYLINENGRVAGEMAETNAEPFFFDTGEVELAEFDDGEDQIIFTASLRLDGEQDLERPFIGDAIDLKVSGLAVRTGEGWTFTGIEIEHISTNA